jgi:ssDNA-binding Zn-finger/Zn-ribbon topoisomerase 1
VNALPTKTCVDCLIVLPLHEFPKKWGRSKDAPYHASTCPQCHKRRNAAAKQRIRERKRLGIRLVDTMPAARPYVPPTDFLPMGEADRGVVLRWSVGMEVGR